MPKTFWTFSCLLVFSPKRQLTLLIFSCFHEGICFAVFIWAYRSPSTLALRSPSTSTSLSDYVSRVREDKETPSATALKAQVMECLNNKLMPYLNIQILFQSELEPFAAEVAIVIEKANNTVKERRKK
ncbi:MAG: hypothetical protein ACK5MI_05305 [Mangrovibacterium sp.]